jgi:hypothetical protein
MAAITIVPLDVGALEPSMRRSFKCGEVIEVGEAVYLASDGTIMLADAGAAVTAQAIGICVAIGGYGKLVSVIGDMCDVVLHGVCTGFSGLTPGLEVFASATAGAMDETKPAGSSGDFVWSIGSVLGAGIIFVRPYTYDVAAQ